MPLQTGSKVEISQNARKQSAEDEIVIQTEYKHFSRETKLAVGRL